MRDGAVRWSRDGSISRAWTTGELLVLRQTDGSGLVALSAADGTERWRSDAQGAVGGRSDQVLVMYDDGSRTTGDKDCDGGCPLTGIDLVTGQTRWTLADTDPAFLGLPLSNGPFPTGPVPTVRHLAVYDELAPGAATPERQRLRVLAVDTGAVERTESVPPTTSAQVAIVGDRLLVIERVPNTDSLGMLRAVPLSAGILGWQARVDGITRLGRRGLLAPGTLLVRLERDRTTFLDLRTGKSTEVSMPRGWRKSRFGDQGDRILATTGDSVLLDSDRDAPSGPVVADLTTGTARTFEKPPPGRVPNAVAGTTLAYQVGPFQDVSDGRDDVFGRQPTQLLLIDLESEQGVEHVTLRLSREKYRLSSAGGRLIVLDDGDDRFHVLEQQ
ncbi:MAG: PQQ-like beta-propeller repeat protein [Actinomycetota bacterium]|nr:PQQ-like beta-propeller repeat protein [Actinomycetota bacterium]